MTTGSQAEFARRYGYSKAAISQFKVAGRLVFISPGILDFKASRQRIIDTADPYRADVVKRHAASRGNENEEDKSTASPSSFQNARTVREKYLALQAKLDYEVNSGLLIQKDHVDRIVFERARQCRDMLMALCRRVAPEIAAITDIKQVEHILEREHRLVLEQFAKLPVVEQ